MIKFQGLSYLAILAVLLTAIMGPQASFADEATASDKEADPKRTFFNACLHGKLDHVGKLLDENPEFLNEFSPRGDTCLMLSSNRKNLDLVKLLVEKGADVNARAIGEEHHRMPVLSLHALNAGTETVSYLIEKGAEVNAEFDGVDEAGAQKIGIFTAVDLIDFIIRKGDEMKNDSRHLQLLEAYRETQQILINNGGRRFVGGEEM